LFLRYSRPRRAIVFFTLLTSTLWAPLKVEWIYRDIHHRSRKNLLTAIDQIERLCVFFWAERKEKSIWKGESALNHRASERLIPVQNKWFSSVNPHIVHTMSYAERLLMGFFCFATFSCFVLNQSHMRKTFVLFVYDPSAGSPTETLLRLLLPLKDQVRPSFSLAVGRRRTGRDCSPLDGTPTSPSEGLTKSFNR